MARFLPLTLPAALAVAANMRAMDRAEIYATRRLEDPAEVAGLCVALSRFGAVFATDQGKPAAALGAVEAWPGVWSVWMFATDEWPRVALAATRWVRRILIPLLLDAGAHRAHCNSLAAHREAHRWLAALGARAEGRLEGFGKGGEDFVSFVWKREWFASGSRASGAGGAAASAGS